MHTPTLKVEVFRFGPLVLESEPILLNVGPTIYIEFALETVLYEIVPVRYNEEKRQHHLAGH